MEIAIVLGGALGAWLLVAGPIYQAAIELGEMHFDHEGMEAIESAVPQPPRMSPWWWLFPPAAYFRQRGLANRRRRAVMDALGEEQRAQTVAFLNKAKGWFTVAAGALLIAIKETWELSLLLDWPTYAFWIAVVVAGALCVANVVTSQQRTERSLKKDEAAARERRGGPGGRPGSRTGPGPGRASVERRAGKPVVKPDGSATQ